MKRIIKFCIVFLLVVIIFIILQLKLYKYLSQKAEFENELHIIKIENCTTYEIKDIKDLQYREPFFLLSEKEGYDFEKKYKIKLPEIDYNERESFIVSYGKPIVLVYYQEKNKGDWSYDTPHAEAIYDNGFLENTIFVYKILNNYGIWSFGLP